MLVDLDIDANVETTVIFTAVGRDVSGPVVGTRVDFTLVEYRMPVLAGKGLLLLFTIAVGSSIDTWRVVRGVLGQCSVVSAGHGAVIRA